MTVPLPSPTEWVHLPWPQREAAVRTARGFLRFALPGAEPPAVPLPYMDPSHPDWARSTREHAHRILLASPADPLAPAHRGRLLAALREAS